LRKKQKAQLVKAVVALVVAFVLLAFIIPAIPDAGNSVAWTGFRGFFVDAAAAITGGWVLLAIIGVVIFLFVMNKKRR